MKLLARLVGGGAVLFFAAGHGLAASKPTAYAHLLGYLPRGGGSHHMLVLAEIPANQCVGLGTPVVLEIDTGVQVKIPLQKARCSVSPSATETRQMTVEIGRAHV